MANSVLTASSVQQLWEKEFLAEYVRQSGLLPYMGTDDNAIIRVVNDLSKAAGDTIHIPLAARLRGSGVTGSTQLRGSEEALNNYSYGVKVTLRRNGVSFGEDQMFRTELDLMNAGKVALRNWAAEQLRNDSLDALQSMIVKASNNSDGTPGEDTNVAYGSATEANKDLWLDNNVDRVLFADATLGQKAISTSAPAGGAVRDHSATLLTIGATDTLSAKVLGIAKRKAKTAGKATGMQHITPFKNDATAGREYYVLFVDSYGFRDLGADTAIINANQYARAREGSSMDNNPLFQDGDLMYQGIVIREIPELTDRVLTGVGASSADVGTAFLCGANALTVAYSQKPQARTEQWDFGHRNSVAIMEIRGQGKTAFAGSQFGAVTLYHGSKAD